jgi:ATP-dependent Clp protease protease subunit
MVKNNTNEIVNKDNKFENASNWLQLGVDIESRRIHVNLHVDETMMSIVLRGLIKMSDISNDPIELHLSSYGGDVYDGLAIYDAIMACPCDVVIRATGKIMSAGLLIFLAGDYRVASEHTTFMAHAVSSGIEGKVRDVEIDVKEMKRLNGIMMNILSQRTKKPIKFWEKVTMSHDKYFDLTEAKELGIITNINSLKPKVVKKTKKKGKR